MSDDDEELLDDGGGDGVGAAVARGADNCCSALGELGGGIFDELLRDWGELVGVIIGVVSEGVDDSSSDMGVAGRTFDELLHGRSEVVGDFVGVVVVC